MTQEQAGCNDQLWYVLEHGIPVEGVCYEDFRDDKFSLNMVAGCSSSHDEDANDYMATTPQQKIRLCLRVKDIQLQWDKTQSWLTTAMGRRTRRQVRRWCEAAKHLPQDILALMDDRAKEKGTDHGLQENNFFESAYLVPPVSKEHFKLPKDWAICAVKQLFQSDICQHMHLTNSLVSHCGWQVLGFRKIRIHIKSLLMSQSHRRS